MAVFPLLLRVLNKSMPAEMSKDEFSKWLCGFIDGEGNFQVFLDRHYLRVSFRIRLHIDDVAILHKIQAFLGVGRVTTSGSYATFTIGNVDQLINVLFPLLDQYNLLTTKWLDYIDFKAATMYRFEFGSALYGEKLEWIKSIMASMNSGRSQYDYAQIPSPVINPFWLLGFIEGEGTFGMKNLVPYFQVGQHSRSMMVMQAVSSYIQSLPQSSLFTLSSKPPVVTNTVNNRTSVSVLSISNIDALYDYLMFFLLSMPFQTRKGIDFYYWCLVLYIHKFGYFYLAQGRILCYKIAQYINTGRYSNNPDGIAAEPSKEEILGVLDTKLPLTRTPEMTQVKFSQAFAKAKGGSKEVWVYKDGVLLSEVPSVNSNAAMRVAGLSPLGSAVRRTIDTGKVVGQGFTFYSSRQ